MRRTKPDRYEAKADLMRQFPLTACAAVLMLAACNSSGPIDAPSTSNLSAELVRRREPGPPPGPDGTCWASSTTPAMIETVTEQVLATAEVTDAVGNVIKPATYRTKVQQKIVREREEVWFTSPCPDQMGPDFIATLQRALKARGLYLLPLTGVLDAATNDAIRRFQAARGLDSPVLSLAMTRELGIVPTALDAL